MNELLNKIFGISVDTQTNSPAVGFGSPDAHLSVVHPIESWVATLVIGAIVVLVWWSYRSVPGNSRARLALGLIRCSVLVVLFALALGPMIEQRVIRTEQDWAMVLVDRSGSMTTRDGIIKTTETMGQNNALRLVTRDEQLIAMLDAKGEHWDELAAAKHLVWMGFGDSLSTLAIGTGFDAHALPSTGGHSTRLGRAIEQALGQANARPISSIVIISDGRSFDGIDPELINTLKSAQIPVFVVPMGSDEPVRDLGITQVEYPRAVFADDLVPIRVGLNASGIGADDLAGGLIRVELIDHDTAEVLDSATIEPRHVGLDADGSHAWVTLYDTPRGSGDRGYNIVIRSDTDKSIGGTGGAGDLNPTNDQMSARLSVVDRPMRVLYIDGYPRWEQRYLKNLLLRERSIVSSSILLAASRRYVQEGDEVLSAVPATLEDWEPFDVVIIGDVRPALFSDHQLGSLLEHVQRHGAGVLWIAGPSATPNAWIDSGISALLPMRGAVGSASSLAHPFDAPVTMFPTDEALRLGLLGLNDQRDGWLDRLSDPTTGWSRLQWALELDESVFKPGVSILARARSVDQTLDLQSDSQGDSPLITMMRYGAGRTIFVGTDEIWRWRYGRGEDLPERFWLPLIRSLGRGTVDRRAAPASLRISPTHPIPGESAQVTLMLFDQSRIDSMPSEVRVVLRSGAAIDEPETITMRGSGDSRIGTWIPEHPGVYHATLDGVDAQLFRVDARVRVLDGSDEQRVLDSDHALLAMIADETGGKVIDPGAFGTIPALMPNRTRTIVSPPRRVSLWDRPIVLLVLIVLVSVEWIGRRVLRLA